MNSIGLKRVTFYLIRHVKTQQIMPLARRNRGYSHWNPSSDGILPKGLFTNIPRILESKKQAERCIAMWNANPNAFNNSINTEDDVDFFVDIKSDNRRKEDLEIIKIRIIKNDS